MSKIYFHPDIDYQGVREIEKKYNLVLEIFFTIKRYIKGKNFNR